MHTTGLTRSETKWLAWAIFFMVALQGASHCLAQQFTEDFSIWPVDLKINGTVIACNGPEIDPTAIEIFNRRSKQGKSKIVAIALHDAADNKNVEAMLKAGDVVTVFEEEKGPTDIDELRTSLVGATGVLLFSNKSLSSANNKLLDQIKESLHDVIDRRGVVCAIGPALASLGDIRHDSVEPMSLMTKDLGLIPNGILYWGYLDESDRHSMYGALAAHPHSVAIGVPKDTCMVLHGRKCVTIGPGKVTYSLSANERQPYRIQQLGDVTGRRASPYNSVVDLTAWRRDAIERQLPAFPAQEPPKPIVEKGTLFIVGGGGMPGGLMTEMVQLAGGKDAHMVFVPCTDRDTLPTQQPSIVRQWKRMGVASARVFHTKDRNKSNSDEEFLKIMEKATGVWFGGGRQWNFADSYYGTKSHQLMKQVLAKGGVIGGSSAGASIQGGYLARANPVANFDIMAPGYERGLGFLPGVAIDQHFSQRGRQKDMTTLANRYPQLLGIGIDEGTAIRVTGSTAKVIGKGKVFFYDRHQPVVPGKDDFTALAAGKLFDLKERTVVEEIK